LIRCAVPSSNTGSCESASAAADRDSGVDAAAGLTAWGAEFAAPTWIIGPGPAGPAGVVVAAPWLNAEAVESMVATATSEIFRMSDAPAMRRDGADVEIDGISWPC
jgi:hypothetical protein